MAYIESSQERCVCDFITEEALAGAVYLMAKQMAYLLNCEWKCTVAFSSRMLQVSRVRSVTMATPPPIYAIAESHLQF